jgi:aldose 1-epimerase
MGERLRFEAGEAAVEVDLRQGGRIASLVVGGLELLVSECADPLAWGCYAMAPFAGRVRGGAFEFEGRRHALPLRRPPHAIHGTTWERTWSDAGGGVLACELGPDWPFPGRAVQRVELVPDALRLRLELQAQGAAFPASIGWHPWFRRRLARGGELRLAFEARAMYRRDADGIPTGELVAPTPGPWDDCFTELVRPPLLHWPGALRLELQSSADHWVVYDEPAHAVCVEPQSGPPDALHIAPRLVAPGRPLALELRLAWSERGS